MSKTPGGQNRKYARSYHHHTSSRAKVEGSRCESFKVTPRDPSTFARDDRLIFVFALDPLQRFLPRFEGAFELARFHCFQDFPKSWARFHSQRDQIVPCNQRWRNDWLVRELFLFALK